jgi:hypothetical protein
MHFTGFGIDGPPPALLFGIAGLLGFRVAGSGIARLSAIATPLLLALCVELAARGTTAPLPNASVLLLLLPPVVAAMTRTSSRPALRTA